jgi:threonine synthase
MWGFQAAGAAPLVLGHPVPNPETVASAIRIGNPASWQLAEEARDSSGGRIDAVTDEQILSAQRALARHDGIFVEPASAAGVAGLIAATEAGEVDGGLTISITVTGNGLKDIETALSGIDSIVDSVIDADVHEAARAAGLA